MCVFFCVKNISLIVSYRLKRELERRGGGGKKVKRRRQRENGENWKFVYCNFQRVRLNRKDVQGRHWELILRFYLNPIIYFAIELTLVTGGLVSRDTRTRDQPGADVIDWRPTPQVASLKCQSSGGGDGWHFRHTSTYIHTYIHISLFTFPTFTNNITFVVFFRKFYIRFLVTFYTKYIFLVRKCLATR